jgi:hypothetical protein
LNAFSNSYIACAVKGPVVRDHYMSDPFHHSKSAKESREPAFLVPSRNDYSEPGSETKLAAALLGAAGWCHEALLKLVRAVNGITDVLRLISIGRCGPSVLS